MVGSGDLHGMAAVLLRQHRRDESDLLSRAAAKIDTSATDMTLAVALVNCAKRIETRLPSAARRMRDAALLLVSIG